MTACLIPLIPEDFRLTTYPIPAARKKTWHLCKKQEAQYWQVHDINLEQDLKDWAVLDSGERHFIKMVLAFFASSDNLVNMNLLERFLVDIPIPEFRRFYTFQAAMENIHAEMYSEMIETYITDLDEKSDLFNAIGGVQELLVNKYVPDSPQKAGLLQAVKKVDGLDQKVIPSIRRKADWAFRWIDSRDSWPHRVLGMLINEGIFFQGSFCAIYWLRERHVMKGLCQANDYIAKDEKRHCKFACHSYSELPAKHRLSVQEVHAMFDEGLDCEVDFITEALPCRLLGMNADSMIMFLRHVANYWLHRIGYPQLYPQAYNPFPFMDMLSIPNKSSFFEVTPTEYALTAGESIKRDDSGRLVFSDDF